jgi:outer membrane protein assembly factor BamB
MRLLFLFLALLPAPDADAPAPPDPRFVPFYLHDPEGTPPGGSVGALHRDTGKVLWRQSLPAEFSGRPSLFRSSRELRAILFSADQRRSRTVWWDLATGRLQFDIEDWFNAEWGVGRKKFLLSNNGRRVRAGDVATGATLWTREDAGSVVVIRDPARPLVVLNLAKDHVALDPFTGEERWRRARMKDEQYGSAAGHFVICTAGGTTLYDVDPATGKDARSIELPGPSYNLSFIGSRILETQKDQVLSIRPHDLSVAWTLQAPVQVMDVWGDDATHLVRMVSGEIILVEARTGRELRRLSVPGGEVRPLQAFASELLLFAKIAGGRAASIFAVDARTGATLWEGEGVECDPGAAAGVLLLRRGAEVRAVDLRTRGERWTATLPGPALAVEVRKGVAIFIGPSHAVALDPVSGRELWRTELAAKADRALFAWPLRD